MHIISGPRTWEGKRDNEGHREWKISHIVACDSLLEGPASALQTPGLPSPGSQWNFGVDIDIWATCKLDADVRPYKDDGKGISHFLVTQTFSTKPDGKRCKDQQIEDPLLQPPKVSGGSNRATEEATHDRFGEPILNSAFEQIRGPQVEFDRSKHTVNIEMNVPNLLIEFVSLFVDTVNANTLWGCAPRTIKLSQWDWEKKYYGTCYAYYTWKFMFEIDSRGFDRDILDEGNKVIRGDWDRDPESPRYTDWLPASSADFDNPLDYIRFKDWNGENCRVILDGTGRPVDTGTGTGTVGATTPGSIHVEKYNELDFLLLGIPTIL